MDKRYKWPINQKRCNYLDQPPNHPRSAYQLHNKSYSRLNHNYKFSNHNASSNNYYNHQPPPPPIYAREAGGGGWPTQMPPQTDSGYSSNNSKNSSSDVVTLIVENNNLKKMIVLHLNLMQEQTDSLTAKDKELYEQNGRIKTLLSQNQELMQQIDKLGQRIEDLRNHLRRRAERSTHEDAEPKTKVHCSADKETQTIELSLEVEQKEQEQKPHLHSYPQKLKQSQRVLVTSVTDLPPTTPILDNSKERDKFNCGKKVSTIFLHRVHQEKSKFQLSNENEDQQLEEEKRDMEEEEVEVEEMQINMEDDEHIYHDALETHEMEVVTETIIGAEEEFCAEEETVDDIDPVNNGHIYEDGEEEEEDEEEDDEQEDDEQEEENDEDEEDLKMEQEIITNNLWQQNDEPQQETEQEEKEHHHQQLYQVMNLDTPFAHSTPLFRPEILNEKKHTSHNSRSMSKPPLNKWELDEEQEQLKLIEQHFEKKKLKIKVDSTMKDSQVQTVEMIHSEVQTEEMNDEDKKAIHILCKPLRENEVRQQEQQKEREQQEERERKKREQRKRDKEAAEKEHSKQKQQEEEQLLLGEEAMRKRQEHLQSLQQRLQRQVKQDVMKVDDTNHVLLTKSLMEHEVQKHEQQNEREKQEDRECKQREQRKRENEKAEKELSKQKQQEEIKLQQEELKIEEEAMRKRQEHLQSQQQRLQSKPQEEEVNLDDKNIFQLLKGLRQNEVAHMQKEREQLEERESKQHEQRKREKEKPEKEQSKQKLQEEKKLQLEEPNIEEEAMRKRQENLQSQQQRLQSKPRLRENEVPIKEREEQEERERKQREQRKREKEAAEKEQSKQKQQENEQLQEKEANIEEEAMRKLQEHLQRQQQRLQNQPQQQLPYVRLKKSQMQTSLIYPPIAPATANQLSPAPSPTNIASPKIVNNNNNSNSSTTTNTIIQTPLTPQSISSVGSNSNSSNTNNSTSSSNKRTIVNNCSPQTYSKSFNSLISRTSARRVSKFRTSTQLYTTRSWEDQEFHCDNEFFLEEADELLADNPSLEIPKWKVVNIRRSPDSKGTEPLSDADFERRHEKDVRDEIERKKRDARYLREQQRSDTLRMRHNQDEVLVPLDPLPTSTFYPLPMDIEGIEFVTEVPVQAFGENVVNLQVQTDDFSLPWLDAATASTAIAKAKADALPVATLASKKLPTTAAEARQQEMNSSYVFLKRRKRLRKR